MMNFIQLFPPLIKAVPVTLSLTILAAVTGLMLGIVAAVAQCSRHRLLAWLATGYIILFRGTPALVQIYLIYYGIAEWLPNPWTSSFKNTFFWPILKEGYWFALLTLILNQGAYNAAILKGTLCCLPKGQIEVAKALGMAPLPILWRVTLPLTLKRSFPMLVNDVIALMKTTALASTITVMDIMGTARLLQRQTALIYEPLFAAAILYLVIVFILIKGMAWLEQTFCVKYA